MSDHASDSRELSHRQVLLGGRATFAATFGGSLAARWPPREPPCGRRATSVPPASARPWAADATQRPGRPSWSDSGGEGAGLRAWPLAGGHSDL